METIENAQVARRLFLLAGASELVAAGDGSGGLDIALGPTLGSSPLGALGPSIILPGLVAGPSTLDPRLTPAALPLVSLLLSSQKAEALLLAVQHFQLGKPVWLTPYMVS
jgi:hypothetical protein